MHMVLSAVWSGRTTNENLRSLDLVCTHVDELDHKSAAAGNAALRAATAPSTAFLALAPAHSTCFASESGVRHSDSEVVVWAGGTRAGGERCRGVGEMREVMIRTASTRSQDAKNEAKRAADSVGTFARHAC